MSIDIRTIQDAVVSHALSLGIFARVNQHEPKVAPGYDLTCAIWADSISPVLTSGLDSTSVRMNMMIRLYTSMIQSPQDAIDQNMVEAVDILCETYSANLQLHESIRNIDLLGSYGIPMEVQAGYVEQDGKQYRVMTLNLPLIVNDVWSQNA